VKHVLIILHQAISEPGLVGTLLQAQGYELDVRCPATGAELPSDLDQHAGVVVFGGPMSANDDDTLPFIRLELDWIETVLAAQTPFLGICLGAQLLARVLGATVSRHPEGIREIGYVPIQPTLPPNGVPNPLSALQQVYHWHQEGFDLPHTATLLATGEVFPHQAFRYGNAYGVQFHPEITMPMIERWTTEAADHLLLPGAQPREVQMQQHQEHGPKVADWLNQFLAQWLNSTSATEQAAPPVSLTL